MRRIIVLLLAAVICVSFAGCGSDSGEVFFPTEPEETKGTPPDRGEMVILFTGGLEGVYAREETQGILGYAALAAYDDQLAEEDHKLILVDGGHSVASNADDGLWDIVDSCSYDLRVPGALEPSTGVQRLVNRADDLKTGTYVSCNLMDLKGDTTVFDPYVILEVGEVKVGFVGVTQPQSLKPMDRNRYALIGEENGQALYDVVQQAVDDAANAGAEFVIVVSNLGTDPEDTPCTAAEVMANTTGFCVWLDSGSDSVLDGDTVTDKDDFEIPVCAPGSRFYYLGQITLNLNDGTAKVELVTDLEEENRTVYNMIQKLKDEE